MTEKHALCDEVDEKLQKFVKIQEELIKYGMCKCQSCKKNKICMFYNSFMAGFQYTKSLIKSKSI